MRNIIKKILKETQLDDFEWVRELPIDPTVTMDNVYNGMRVKLKRSSSYVGQTKPGELGTVVFDSEYPMMYDINDKKRIWWVRVEWDESKRDTYRVGPEDFDLDFVVEAIKESEDSLDWIKEPSKTPLNGLKLRTPLGRNYILVIDNGDKEVTVRTKTNGDFKYDRRTVQAFIERGTWKIINESEDPLDWIKEPSKRPLDGVKLISSVGSVLTIKDNGGDYVDVTFDHFEGSVKYDRNTVKNKIGYGVWRLTESEDPFEWIKKLKPAIILEPKTMYYFNPPLESEEVYDFADRIQNADTIRRWLMNGVYNSLKQSTRVIGVNYFVTGDDTQEHVDGWCTETTIEEGFEIYDEYNHVNARKEFKL